MRHGKQLSKSSLKALSAAISIAVFSIHGNANAQNGDPEVEEVVVTGSFIRRTAGFTSASPVTQITAAAASRPKAGPRGWLRLQRVHGSSR